MGKKKKTINFGSMTLDERLDYLSDDACIYMVHMSCNMPQAAAYKDVCIELEGFDCAYFISQRWGDKYVPPVQIIKKERNYDSRR